MPSRPLLLLAAAVSLLWTAPAAPAQRAPVRFGVSVGAGPVLDAPTRTYTTGGQAQLSAAHERPGSRIGFRADLTYNQWGLTESLFCEHPGGPDQAARCYGRNYDNRRVTVLGSATYGLSTTDLARVYLIAGVGAYRNAQEVTQFRQCIPGTECDERFSRPQQDRFSEWQPATSVGAGLILRNRFLVEARRAAAVPVLGQGNEVLFPVTVGYLF